MNTDKKYERQAKECHKNIQAGLEELEKLNVQLKGGLKNGNFHDKSQQMFDPLGMVHKNEEFFEYIMLDVVQNRDRLVEILESVRHASKLGTMLLKKTEVSIGDMLAKDNLSIYKIQSKRRKLSQDATALIVLSLKLDEKYRKVKYFEDYLEEANSTLSAAMTTIYNLIKTDTIPRFKDSKLYNKYHNKKAKDDRYWYDPVLKSNPERHLVTIRDPAGEGKYKGTSSYKFTVWEHEKYPKSGFDIFFEYLQDEFSEENPIFILDCKKWIQDCKEVQAIKNPVEKLRGMRALISGFANIYETFTVLVDNKKDWPSKPNIPSHQYKNLGTAYYDNPSIMKRYLDDSPALMEELEDIFHNPVYHHWSKILSKKGMSFRDLNSKLTQNIRKKYRGLLPVTRRGRSVPIRPEGRYSFSDSSDSSDDSWTSGQDNSKSTSRLVRRVSAPVLNQRTRRVNNSAGGNFEGNIRSRSLTVGATSPLQSNRGDDAMLTSVNSRSYSSSSRCNNNMFFSSSKLDTISDSLYDDEREFWC